MLTNLGKPSSSLAGLQQRVTKAGSWPNVSSSGFAAPPNSSPPRRSDNAVQKISEPKAMSNARRNINPDRVLRLSRRPARRARGQPQTRGRSQRAFPCRAAGTRISFRLQLPMIRLPTMTGRVAAAATRPLADAKLICVRTGSSSFGFSAKTARMTCARSASVTACSGFSGSLPCWMLARFGCT
jgi:hypothetical protein